MDDGGQSTLSTLIARIEAYASDPACLGIPGPSTRHELWLQDESKRIDSATQLAEELLALQSIYTDGAIHLLKIANLSGESKTELDTQTGMEEAADPESWLPGAKITLSITADVETSLSTTEDAVPIRLAVTLPPFYPYSKRPPQLQLLSRYIGGFSVDSKLFGEILRAFYHQTGDEVQMGADVDAEEVAATARWVAGSMDKGVNWQLGQVVLFEGIEWVKEKVVDWWNDKEKHRLESAPSASSPKADTPSKSEAAITTFNDLIITSSATDPAPFTGKLYKTEPIVERKSEFIGYAATLSSPSQVASILSLILSDKRVARATHPIINAWVCRASDGVVHRDCDDDGESAAGGRLAHLLNLLELENVIVVVTRWYGGVHLGPDRFKLINRAAREALDLGGFLEKNVAEEASKGKGMGKRVS